LIQVVSIGDAGGITMSDQGALRSDGVNVRNGHVSDGLGQKKSSATKVVHDRIFRTVCLFICFGVLVNFLMFMLHITVTVRKSVNFFRIGILHVATMNDIDLLLETKKSAVAELLTMAIVHRYLLTVCTCNMLPILDS
jgi:hypothetical protein